MYSEYLKNGGTGIIQLLANNQTLSYLLSDDIKTLDSAFLLENGEKEFSIPVENLLKNENDFFVKNLCLIATNLDGHKVFKLFVAF